MQEATPEDRIELLKELKKPLLVKQKMLQDKIDFLQNRQRERAKEKEEREALKRNPAQTQEETKSGAQARR